MTFYNHISELLKKQKLFALQVDPDKHNTASLVKTARHANLYGVDFLLVGGSLVSAPIDETIRILKAETDKHIIIFPGNILQISELADGILLLCLISGRNPEYLIGNHVVAAPLLKKSGLEIIPTGYVLIENGRSTSVEYITNTKPIPADKTDLAVATAMAGEMLGHKLLYLEAGSGAIEPVKTNLISEVKKNIQIPLIVGGGIQHPDQLRKIFMAGADIVVVGTAFENSADNIPVLADAVRNLPSMQ